MTNEYKFDEGFCAITLNKLGSPLIIYRIDREGNPVIEENEVIFLRIAEISKEGGIQKVKVGVSGKSYQFVRGDILDSYNKERCRLSRENFHKLKKILDEKMRRLTEKHNLPNNGKLETRAEA